MTESVEQLDPTQELSTDIIKKRAAKGAAILTGRNILVQLISFVSLGLLTVFLSPAEFGLFYIVSAVKNFLAYFSSRYMLGRTSFDISSSYSRVNPFSLA